MGHVYYGIFNSCFNGSWNIFHKSIFYKMKKQKPIENKKEKSMKKNKRKALFVFGTILIVSVFILTFFMLTYLKEKTEKNSSLETSNPASNYCIDNGGNIEIRTNPEGGQYGVCIKNEKECEEWQYYQGGCIL